MNNLKVVFMGTPDFAVPVLEGLINSYNVIGVVTQPDRKKGRDKDVSFSPIKEVAIKNNIKVFQPEKIRTEYSEIVALNPDIIITCAYGQIVPKEILESPSLGCINVHASLLPQLRGAAPIQRAIMDGLKETGITIMYMDEHMDTGDIISMEKVLIHDEMNAQELHDVLSLLGKKLLLETLPSIIEGTNKKIKQDDSNATYAKMIKREDELINFNNSAINIYNQIRGLNPIPCAYAMLDGKIMKIYSSRITNNKITAIPGKITNIYEDGFGVSTKDFEIVITKIKPEGKKVLSAKEYLNGINKSNLLNKQFNEE